MQRGKSYYPDNSLQLKVEALKVELTLYFVIQGPSQENRKSLNPFFHADEAVVVFVKRPEDWRTDNHWEHVQVTKQSQ